MENTEKRIILKHSVTVLFFIFIGVSLGKERRGRIIILRFAIQIISSGLRGTGGSVQNCVPVLVSVPK